MWTTRRITDLDEGMATLRAVLGAPVIPAPGTRLFNMRLQEAMLPMLSVSRLGFGIEFSAESEAADYHVVTVTAGQVEERIDQHRLLARPGTTLIINRAASCAARFSPNFTELGVHLPERVLRQQLEAMLDRSLTGRIAFDWRMHSPQWRDLVNLLMHAAGSDDGLLANPLAASNLQQLVIEGLLLLASHNYSAALADDPRASATVVKLAVDAITEAPQTPWSTATLARLTGVSARSLQKAFAHEGQPPPMTYLREVRLARVHDELLRAEPGTVTVAAVARRWGFLHAGRFSQHYRDLFGESPSATLRVRVGP